jgi:arginase family enzyme
MEKCGLLHGTPMGRVHYVRRNAWKHCQHPRSAVCRAGWSETQKTEQKFNLMRHKIHRFGSIFELKLNHQLRGKRFGF